MLSSIRVLSYRTYEMLPNSIGYLDRQIRSDHGKTGQYKCYDCGAFFTRKDNLSRHQLKHPSSLSHGESRDGSDRSTDDESKSASNKSSGNDSESRSDRSTDDESKSESNKSSGNNSESRCSQSDENCDGEINAEKDTVMDSEMDAETDEATNEAVDGETETDGETDEDSSGDEYDRAYDDDNRSTMRRMLRATRRFIRITSNILMENDSEKTSMDYERSDVYQDDVNQENGASTISPLEVLQVLKKEIRKARRGE